jgi:hypothetical protein
MKPNVSPACFSSESPFKPAIDHRKPPPFQKQKNERSRHRHAFNRSSLGWSFATTGTYFTSKPTVNTAEGSLLGSQSSSRGRCVPLAFTPSLVCTPSVRPHRTADDLADSACMR